ncbi:MAG: Ig-like domain-containing protein [Vicinamibacterales bacterium]
MQRIKDRIGKLMTPAFSSSFTTVDVTPPVAVDLSPASGSSGAPIASVVRVKYSEPVDVSRFASAPIVVRKAGTVVDGRIDYVLGNTAVVFTPLLPLDEDGVYDVQTLPAFDLSGNLQPAGLSYTFGTTDRTAPTVTALVPAGNGTVIENALAQVVADVGASHDVAVVDFYLNDQPSFAARTAPFTLNFQALASLGAPGAQIKVSALATDTSGNRSVTPAVAFVSVVADQPPALTITAPQNGAAVRNGDRINVSVRALDDLGVKQVGYRAQTGKPQDAATTVIEPTSVDRTETFGFNIPADAIPGSTIAINASALDTKGQSVAAAPVSLTVLDGTPPTVTITGISTGAKVSQGQQTTAVVSAQDAGGIASIVFTIGGAMSGGETRTVSPVQNSVATAFAFTVPAGLHAGDVITLDAIARDAAGNSTAAARVLLPVADLAGPTITLRTTSGSLDLVPGSPVTVLAQVDDETAVATVALNGQGAFTVAEARQISPPSNSSQPSFVINVPESAGVGTVLQLSATAVDVFGNTSAPATLALTVKSVLDVALPPSVLVAAGETTSLSVDLSGPAPAGGVRIDLASANFGIAGVTSSLQFAAGETSKSAIVTGVAGGTVAVSASIGGVLRASTTVTVRGGIVTGTVFSPTFQPVAGADVTILAAGLIYPTTTDATGAYRVEGVSGVSGATALTVKARDPVTQLIGFVNAQFNAPQGYVQANIVLLSAGSLGGTVFTADGVTSAGVGARVDIFESGNLNSPVGSTFTDENGAYEFPLVTLGTYTLEASDVSGNLARSTSVVLAASGQHVDQALVYLGRGTVVGTVRDGSGNLQSNIPLTFNATSLFGAAPTVTANSLADGTFLFENVSVGTFTVQARDTITNLAGTATGSITQHQQQVAVTVTLASWGGIQGTVFRPDGVTPASNARVTLSASSGGFSTNADADGHYAFTFVPLGNYTLNVDDAATRGLARATGTLVTNATVVTVDLTELPQGTVLATVVDANGVAVPGASVHISSSASGLSDGQTAPSGADGSVLFEHVLAGSLSVSANSGGLTGSLQTTLAANQVRSVTVALEATGSIAGTVFLPDGATPASTAKVALCQSCVGTAVNSDGTFRFDGLDLRTRTLYVTDANNRLRAKATVVLSSNGQVATADMTMVGIGSVIGRVLNPNGSSAPNLTVSVKSLTPTFGNSASPKTDAAGFYRADNIIVGTIQVNTGNVSAGTLGEGSGTLAPDGATLTIDILLQNSAVTMPQSRSDANLFPYDVQRGGSLNLGNNNVTFHSTAPYTGGVTLDIVSGGTPTRFAGTTNIGTTEANGREIAVSQSGMAGLNITRKVLVSSTYFARYLELLSNPTVDPITVDVRIESTARLSQIGATSSGDTVLAVDDPLTADRWIEVDSGPTGDAFSFQSSARLAYVFDGAGAPQRVAAPTFDVPATGVGRLRYGWNSVTVPPGQTVAFMHFVSQEAHRASAQAAAERLAQLPPEALESLSAFEISAIANFVVPTDSSSPLAALPALNGTITGHIYEADGVTPVSATDNGSGYHIGRLVYMSNHPLFPRPYSLGSNLAGFFSIAPASVGFGFSVAATVPVYPFTLINIHDDTAIPGPTVVGTFADGTTTTVTDVVYSGAALIRGVVRRHTGAPVSGARISTQFTSGSTTYGGSYANSTANGSYYAGGILPGAVNAFVSIPHPQRVGTVNLGSTTPLTVSAGQVLTQDLIFQPTGTLQGTVRTALGAIKAGVTVDLLIDTVTTTNRLRTTTDSSGFYRFNDVKLGTFTVQTTDPVSLILTKAIATIAQDATSVVDLTYIGTSSVQVTATFSTGAPAVGAPVSIQKTTLGTTFSFVANADANGVVTIPNVPAGAFIVRVQRPGFNTALTQVDVPGVVTAQDVPVAIAAVVVPFGTVQLQVNTANGSPVPSAVVQSDYASTTGSFSSFTADANGALTFPSVAGFRDFRVRASLASNTSDYREVTARITSEGQVLPITIGVGTSGSVSGRIVDKAGAPLSGISVLAYSSSPQVTHSGTTDADGAYSITDVPVGDFRLMVTSGPNGTGGSTLARMAQHGDAMTIDLALTQVRQPVTFSDANGYSYYIDQEGRVGNFRSTDAFYTMFRLAATVSGGSNATFSGDSLMTPQLDGRQLEVKDFGNSGPTRKVISGTSVYITRRVYVPTSGYFVRYLDILENTGVAAASIDLQISGTLSSSTIAASSDGDTTLATTDGWVVTHTPNSIVIPPAGLVLVGPGARTGLSTATTTLSVNRLQPTLAWKNIVVPAGGRAIVMHFGTQEPTVAAAQAAAERLVQLPPEALTGLSAADAEAIVNFAVPVDLSSNQTAFGTISGQVRLGDGVTPAAGAVVTVTGSTTPIFKPSVTVTAGADGQYSISTLAVGVGTVQAKDAVSAATSPVSNFALSQPELPLTQDLVLGGGVLSGIVTVGANAVPPGAAILITGGSPAVNLSPAVSNGTYRISLPTGTYNVRFTMTGRTFTMNNVEVLDGQVTTASYRFPAIATVRVTVKTATGAILPSAKVTLTDVGSTHVVANANSLGVALVPTVLEGPITVTARTFNGSLVAIVTSQVRPEDNGLIVDVLGQAANGGVLGVVTALDGQTGVPFARVRVYDVERNVQIDNDFTASDGSYSFPSVSVIGSQGFLVRVFSPFDTSLTSEQTGSFADGLAQTLNFSLPIGVLRGTVTLDGTEPIPGATVRLYQELAGFVDVQSATANPQGEYAFVGQGPGNFELVATEPSQIQIPEDWAGEPLPPERLLNATVTGTIPASPAVVTANVQMPPFGTVVVEVQDSDGSTLDEVSAGLASGGVVTRAATYYDPDSGGSSSVTFEHVPLGPFTVQGCWIVDVSRCGTAVGTMTSPNQIVHMTVQVRDGVHVYGQAQNADDSARANSRVVLKAGTDGVLEPWTDTYDTDDSGFFDFGYIPSGPFTLVLEDQSDGIPIGVVQATGAPDGDLEVNIRASAGVVGCNPSLTTTDTFRYDVSCVGELRTGGTTDDRLAPAYAPAASLLTVQGVSPTAEPAAQLEVGDRQVAHGPRGVGAVTVTRRAYVPEAGGFARFLETLTNNSSTALTVEVRVDSVLAGPIHTLVEPTATGNTYAVTLATPVLSEDGNLARPMLAHVFAGPSAAVGVANTHFQWLSGPSYYTWTVTIPAGESVSLMHFAVQGEPDNLAATDALAQSLANLSNADALNGLSVEEKAGVVNFNIP